MNIRNITIVSLIILGISTRLIPHLPNFTAVGAVALFAGAMFKDGFKAFFIPLLILFISDLIINNVLYAAYFDSFQWFTPGFGYIYAGFAITTLIGRLNIKDYKVLPIFGGVLASTLVFFLLTNFGSWTSNVLYPKNFTGLMEAYTAGLPFLLNQLASTALYTTVLFASASFLVSSRKSLSLARA